MPELINKLCEGCGERFEPKRPWQRFCKIKCRNKFHNYYQGLAMKQFKEKQNETTV